MFDRKIITPGIVLFTLLLLGCISYAQFSGEDSAHQPSEDATRDSTPVANGLSDSSRANEIIWHALWDSWEYDGDDFNTVKVPSPSRAGEVLDDGKNVFVSLSHRWKRNGEKLSKDRWKSILRGFTSVIINLDTERTIVLLQDEPLSGNNAYTLEEVEFLAYWAKEYWGDDIQVGFSFTRGSVLRRELPQNIDFAILPMYLFFREDYRDVQIWNEQEFHDEFDRLIQKAKEKLPDEDLFVIGQAFYNPDHVGEKRRKWRQPPIEAPEWYAEAVQRNHLKGIIWWFWRGNDENVGLSDMPEYFEAIQELN